MNGTNVAVAVVLGVLGLADLMFVLAACRLSGRMSRLEERGDFPRPE